ncbi:MAG: glycosyltransferase family 2 protein, partial [Lactovum sp.]
IHHVELIQNLGIGAAMQTGYKYALENNYDFAVQFDGDGQHDLKSLKDLLQPLLKKEVDFTVGSRFIDKSQSEYQSSLMRRLGIYLISKTIYLFSGLKVKDATSGYRACNHKVISLFAQRYPIKYPEPESYIQLARKNYKIKEVAVNMYERKTGNSSIRSWNSIPYMFYVLISIIILSFERKEK